MCLMLPAVNFNQIPSALCFFYFLSPYNLVFTTSLSLVMFSIRVQRSGNEIGGGGGGRDDHNVPVKMTIN